MSIFINPFKPDQVAEAMKDIRFQIAFAHVVALAQMRVEQSGKQAASFDYKCDTGTYSIRVLKLNKDEASKYR